MTAETVKRIIDTQVNLPADFTPHPRLKPLLDRRAAMREEDAIDWATGELLAFGALVLDGHPVRLVGQDSRRGTFGQRHAVLVDRHTGAEYTPLKQLESGAAKFFVHDSLLSEFAAMGFEYGYSVARPDALVCWEAQFGDFINGAQTIIDEFISSGEQKWGQRSGVVLLLPHGYDGQGPDHSSARVERFLTLCAEDNMTVAMPTHAGQLLPPAALAVPVRPAQAADRVHPEVHAAAEGGRLAGRRLHQRVVPAADRFGAGVGRRTVRRVVLCSGKVYYDLAARRRAAATGRDRHRDRPGRAAVPAAGLRAVRRAGPVPGGGVGHLGAGGAGQHGRLADHGAEAAAGARPRGRRGVAAGQLSARGRFGQAARHHPPGDRRDGHPPGELMYVYFTDRGIEELEERRGEEQVSMAWLAERLRDFVDLNPGFDVAVDRLASFLARLDDEED